MLPTNVMSFMKKMVATGEAGPAGADGSDSGTLSKLRQTLSTGLMTAQDRVNKFAPNSNRTVPSPPEEPQPEEKPPEPSLPKPTPKEPGKPPCRTGACRVCLKSLKPEDVIRVCGECHFKVCEDCASYTKQEDLADDAWRCSICRRKLQSRAQVQAQDSMETSLELPVVESLQRRHSDVKLGGSSGLTPGGGPGGGAGAGAGGLGAGLAPPRSPELRRHSDVSPASLKELEKVKIHVAGSRRGSEWEPDARQNKRGVSPGGGSRAASPQTTGGGGGQDDGDPGEEWRRRAAHGAAGRRRSRVQKQHSYDDEIKAGGAPGGPGGAGEVGLGLPVQLPRRASAYDVYQTGGALSPQAMAAALQAAARGGPGGAAGPPEPSGRRASFRKPDDPSAAGLDGPDTIQVHPEEERRTRRRGSQLPDINKIRAAAKAGAGGPEGVVPLAGVIVPPVAHPHRAVPGMVAVPPVAVEDAQDAERMRRQTSVTDGEAIKIVIHDVDSEPNFGARGGASKRRVVLRRDPSDKAHRTRGFGMRVVGGKSGPDGRLFAYIVWTVPGGPAEKGGLQQGDKVLEWGGVPLTDRSFEEVCSVMDRTGDVAELLVEHCSDLRMCDFLDDPAGYSSGPRKSGQGEQLGLSLDAETEKAPASPTRRKLPKTPEQMLREKQVSGRIQMQVWLHDDDLVVSVLAADDLACRSDDTGHGTIPEAYAKLRLLPVMGDEKGLKTDIAEPTHNPVWNATLEFSNIKPETLMDRTMEVTLWDACPGPERDTFFLGECSVDLQKAFLDDRPVWYRLEDPKCTRAGGKSPLASPRGSLASDMTQRLMRNSGINQRSFSEERDSESESGLLGSPEFSLLHPDHAWSCMGSGASSRRGSSQSEQLEVETYQLDRDFSRSQPGSRRSSFQSAQNAESKGSLDNDLPPINFNKERRRSSATRGNRDPEELLRQLKAAKGDLGRTMSFSGEAGKRGPRRGQKGRKHSMMEVGSLPRDELARRLSERLAALGPDSDDDEHWEEKPLGPGQVKPRASHTLGGVRGQVEMVLLMTKGQLEVDIKSATFTGYPADNPPDTYVKTYLRDGERRLQKRKTRVVRRSCNPQYQQTLRYSACDVLGRSLIVMLWEKQGSFEHNQGLGGAEVALDRLTLTNPTHGAYPLFPIASLGSGMAGSDGNESP
ncbi:regulating synaptic membrane exocytosis protein 1 isoform X2 [Frankliniella occidentalis]|uniref:Regulating synaptic membrane exocytosis protein 1 isoform X2 n=1 Tax=Frankliniella occidentalis TaxID=133901 RepID=A0A9C6XSW4_FRAOC|nr:regulating synaptic membrane exocytosis protein 1 isoform X2 [Frankliniella occidentalis]